MPLAGLNHVNVITNDVPRTVAFYRDVLGLTEGDRPAFDFPGAWLYCGAEPIVHISGTRGRDMRSGVIDHIAFSARDLGGTLARLERAGIRALPRRQPGTGIWQVFVDDPNGARVELDFCPEETLQRAQDATPPR